jgi:hypothetical protein
METDTEEPPHLFLCPISMEVMDDPVTVSTGVTYDRRSIEQWLLEYGGATYPAIMQPLPSLDLTPNHTLKRVIDSWLGRGLSPSTSSLSSPAHELATPLARMLEVERLQSALADLEETPFKVTELKTVRARIAGDVALQCEFVSPGGVQVVGRVMAQALAECGAGGDFSSFTVCEEAAAALPLSDPDSVALVLAPECMRPVMTLLQRGGAEARLHAMDILTKASSSAGATGDHWTAGVDVDDVLKPLLELLSDEGSTTRLGSRTLDVLLEVVERASRGTAKAVEVGAVHVLVELLADADDRRDVERILLLLKCLCKCPEGRSPSRSTAWRWRPWRRRCCACRSWPHSWPSRCCGSCPWWRPRRR